MPVSAVLAVVHACSQPRGTADLKDADKYLNSEASPEPRLGVAHSSDNAAASVNYRFGIMLVGLRISEIGEYTVTHIAGNVAAVPLDAICTDVLIGAIHCPKIFAVELFRKLRLTDEITKHDAQLPTLNLNLLPRQDSLSRNFDSFLPGLCRHYGTKVCGQEMTTSWKTLGHGYCDSCNTAAKALHLRAGSTERYFAGPSKRQSEGCS